MSVLALVTMASCSSPPKGRLPLVIVPQTLTPLISRLRLGEDPYHPFTFNALSLSPSSEPIFRLYSQLAYRIKHSTFASKYTLLFAAHLHLTRLTQPKGETRHFSSNSFHLHRPLSHRVIPYQGR